MAGHCRRWSARLYSWVTRTADACKEWSKFHALQVSSQALTGFIQRQRTSRARDRNLWTLPENESPGVGSGTLPFVLRLSLLCLRFHGSAGDLGFGSEPVIYVVTVFAAA